MSTLNKLINDRLWIKFIDDERDIGNSIIVMLDEGWFFMDDKTCGVKGFDTIAEVKSGTKFSEVIYKPAKTVV